MRASYVEGNSLNRYRFVCPFVCLRVSDCRTKTKNTNLVNTNAR